MAHTYDLVIVGGGPAGLMAARVAGENGLKTALLERKTDITRVRRVDGGGLVPLNEYMSGEKIYLQSRRETHRVSGERVFHQVRRTLPGHVRIPLLFPER